MGTPPNKKQRVAVLGSGIAAASCARLLAESGLHGGGDSPAASDASGSRSSPSGARKEDGLEIFVFVSRGKFASQMHGEANQALVTPGSPFYDYGHQYFTTYSDSAFCREIEKHWLAGGLVREFGGERLRRAVVGGEAGSEDGGGIRVSSLSTSHASLGKGGESSGGSHALDPGDAGLKTRCFFSPTGMWDLQRSLFARLERDFPGRVHVVWAFPDQKLYPKGLEQHGPSKKWALKLGKARPLPSFSTDHLRQLGIGSGADAGSDGVATDGAVLFDYVVGAFGQHVCLEPFISYAGGEEGVKATSQAILHEVHQNRCNQIIAVQVKVKLKDPSMRPPWVGMHVIGAGADGGEAKQAGAGASGSACYPVAFVGNNSEKQSGELDAKNAGGGSPTPKKGRFRPAPRMSEGPVGGAVGAPGSRGSGFGDDGALYLTLLSSAGFAEYEFNMHAKSNYRSVAEQRMMPALDELLHADWRARSGGEQPGQGGRAAGGGGGGPFKVIDSYQVNRVNHWEDGLPIKSIGGADGCLLDSENKLGWCGDICLAPSAEGAWLSGARMANKLLRCMEGGSGRPAGGAALNVDGDSNRMCGDAAKHYSKTDIGWFAFPPAALGTWETHFFDYLDQASGYKEASDKWKHGKGKGRGAGGKGSGDGSKGDSVGARRGEWDSGWRKGSGKRR